MQLLQQKRMWSRRFLGVLCWILVCATVAADDKDPNVAVLALGHVGTAVAQCLSKSGFVVHVWSRTRPPESDEWTVHDSAQAAVQKSSTILIFIDSWEGTRELLESLQLTKDKNTVVFSTYTPADIEKVQGIEGLVGGAIVGVPQTICTKQTLVLTTKSVPELDSVGRNVALGDSIGLASLVNMCLIWIINFGVAGHELAHLALQRFGADVSVVTTYSELAVSIGTTLTAMLLPAVSQSFQTNDYSAKYVPVGIFRRVFQGQMDYLKTLGIENTFLDAYVTSLARVPEFRDGPAAWTQHLSDAPLEQEL